MIFLAIATSFVDARPVNFAADIDCYIKYLKSVTKLQCDFPLHDVLSSEFEDCDAAVESFATSVYSEAAKKLEDDITTTEIASCMVEEFRTHNYADGKMLSKVFDMSTQMSAVTKKDRIDEIEAKHEIIHTDSVQRCIADKVFGAIFDGMFRTNKSSSIESYCKRKFVVDNNMIDRKVHHFVVNPNNVVDATANCDAVVSGMVSKLEAIMEAQIKPDGEDEALNESEAKCIMKQYRKKHFFNNMLLVSVFFDLNINEIQKKAERKRFINELTDSMFFKCREVSVATSC